LAQNRAGVRTAPLVQAYVLAESLGDVENGLFEFSLWLSRACLGNHFNKSMAQKEDRFVTFEMLRPANTAKDGNHHLFIRFT
jgi:hypothetical protein